MLGGFLDLDFAPFTDYLGALNSQGVAVAFLLAVPLLWLLTFVHELGHALAGRLVGFKTLYIWVGPLHIEPHKRGVRVKYNWAGVKPSGAAHLHTENPDDPHFRRRYALILLAGPLASLVLAVTAFGAHRALGLAAFEPYELYAWELYTALLLTTIGTFAAWQALGNLAPLKVGNFLFDGLQLLNLRDPAFVERLQQSYRYQGLYFGSVRPRDWDLRVLAPYDQFDPERNPAEAFPGLISGYFYALDSGDVQAAKDALDKALTAAQAISPVFNPTLHFEAAYFYAFHLGDQETAQVHFGRGAELNGDEREQVKAQVALLLAEGRYHEAVERADWALAYQRGEPDSGARRTEIEWLLAMRERAVVRQAA